MLKDREAQLKYMRDYMKQKREAARKEGLCIICLKNPVSGTTTCSECRLRILKKRYKQNDASL